MTALTINVIGQPAPQGSKRHVGAGRMVESSDRRVRSWRESVKWATWEAARGPIVAIDGPVAVRVMFRMERPKGHYGTGRNAGEVKLSAKRRPTGKPDIDKLVRSTLDALSEAGLFRDDAQVVRLAAGKRWCGRGEPAGADIHVRGIR